MAPLDAALLERAGSGLALCPEPYAALGATLGLGGDAVIERLRRLVAHGLIGGLGPCWAADAQEGLSVLAERHAEFDVVFSDVVMPGMNGIALAQEIRRLYVDLPVVLTSGYSHVLAQNGTYGFELLHKPYSADQLSRILQGVNRPRS